MKISPKGNRDYRYEDLGLFIGLITVPYHDILTFYNEEIKEKLFGTYKSALIENFDSASAHIKQNHPNDFDEVEYANQLKTYNDLLYSPRAYCVLGTWDIAVISLVDDFEFGVRTFQSFSSIAKPNDAKPEQHERKTHGTQDFSYQVVTGLSPVFNYGNEKKPMGLGSLESFWKKHIAGSKRKAGTAGSRAKPLPLIGVCSLKINPALIIGSSVDSYKDIIVSITSSCSRLIVEKAIPKGSIEVLVLETLSWNEVEIVLFSDSYVSITEIIHGIKELRVRDIEIPGAEYKTPIPEGIEGSLLKKYTDKNEQADVNKINASHLFVKSVETLGFDFEILDEVRRNPGLSIKQRLETVEKILEQWGISFQDSVRFVQRWFVKPGHLQDLRNIINQYCPEYTDHDFITVGNSDYSLTPKEVRSNGDLKKTKLSSRYLVRHILTSIEIEIEAHIHQIVTIPEVEFTSVKDETTVQNEHTRIHRNLCTMQFSQNEINAVSSKLRALTVSKIISGKFLNTLSTYNEGIADSALYGYFIELAPFLRTAISTIDQCYREHLDGDYCNETLISLQYKLHTMSEAFQRAFQNRMQQSHKMLEISDYNLEFKGGVQQLVSAFDAVYKLYCLQLCLPEGFAYIKSAPGITSRQFSVRLNFHHIYQPEIFFIVIGKEVSNFLIYDFKTFEKEDSYVKGDEHVVGFKNFRDTINDLEHVSRFFWVPKSSREGTAKKLSDIQTLQECLWEDLGVYLLADLISLMTVFNGDLKLYIRCFWLYFAQDSVSYVSNNELHIGKFSENFVRVLILKHVLSQFNPSKYESLEADPVDSCFSEPYRILNNEKLTKPFIEQVVERLVPIGERGMASIQTCLFQVLHQLNRRTCPLPYFSHKSEDNERFNRDVAKAVEQNLVDVSEGKMIRFGELGTNKFNHPKLWAAQRYEKTRIMTYFFKEYLTRVFVSDCNSEDPNKSYTKVLVRKSLRGSNGTDAGKPQFTPDYCKSGLMIDPRGGIFTTLPDKRRKHFKETSAMMRSLWGLSNELKIAQFGRLINLEDFDDSKEDELIETRKRAQDTTIRNRRVKIFFSYTGANRVFVNDIQLFLSKYFTEAGLLVDWLTYEKDKTSAVKTLTQKEKDWVRQADVVLMDVSSDSLVRVRCLEEFMLYHKEAKKVGSKKRLFAPVCFDNVYEARYIKQQKKKMLKTLLPKMNQSIEDNVTKAQKLIVKKFFKNSDGIAIEQQNQADLLKTELYYFTELFSAIHDAPNETLHGFWEQVSKAKDYTHGGREKMNNWSKQLANSIVPEFLSR